MKSNRDIWGFKLTKRSVHSSVSKKYMEELDSLDKSNEGQNTMTGWLREQDPDFKCEC